MAEDLKTTTYNDGKPIKYISQEDPVAWEENTTGAYTWYPNDMPANTSAHGALYNWYAVDTGQLCPTDWHVPSDEEWTQLELVVGDSVLFERDGTVQWVTSAGIKLKAENSWRDATDEYGFSALSGGFRNPFGFFAGRSGWEAAWWTSTEYSHRNAWQRGMRYSRDFIYRYDNSKAFGYSVRCVKD